MELEQELQAIGSSRLLETLTVEETSKGTRNLAFALLSLYRMDPGKIEQLGTRLEITETTVAAIIDRIITVVETNETELRTVFAYIKQIRSELGRNSQPEQCPDEEESKRRREGILLQIGAAFGQNKHNRVQRETVTLHITKHRGNNGINITFRSPDEFLAEYDNPNGRIRGELGYDRRDLLRALHSFHAHKD